MSPGQLKSLVETGHYRPDTALVAEAMLRRPGVRALLALDPLRLTPAHRTPPVSAGGHQAA
jgi:hypothetical protein